MKKKKVSSRMIAFFSPKCNQTMLVFSKAARKAAMMLEGDVRVQSYETQVPIVINPSNIQTTGIRGQFFDVEWVSDFKVESVDGECDVLEAVGESELHKLVTAEKLELSRRHWNSEGYKWMVVVVEGE